MVAKSKPDYAFKSYLLNNGLYDNYRRANFDINWFLDGKTYNNKINLFSNETFAYNYLENMLNVLPKEYKECIRIRMAEHMRSIRLNHKIKEIVFDFDNQPLFLTLTFTNKVLNSTSNETRRRYVSRWLKENSIKYVANIDYGEKNGREHYHAVVLASSNINYLSWSYGALNGQKIINKNPYKIKNYINKLTNHAIKKTAKQNRLIYSRKVNN